MTLPTFRRAVLAGLVSVAALVPGRGAAQILDESGLVATGLLLRQMDGVKRVLMIGAHPDDEDTSLLTSLSRRFGAETAYLALTRGEGGQNLIGPELWEGLGIIRTGELEAARRLDGGRQFFTRAFDFGYSKRAEEALTFWPHDELLHDVVWVVRSFRPHVIVSVFRGEPSDGHGQHQAAGIMAREVFEAAGDPSRFPEQLERGVEAWAPIKMYRVSWRRPSEATTSIETGSFDPLLGRSDYQLAMESRSSHRSQDMGAPRPMGPRASGISLLEDRTGSPEDLGIFAGIDTTLVGAAQGLPSAEAATTRVHLQAYRAAVEDARRRFGGLDPFAVVEPLQDALHHLYAAAETSSGRADAELRMVLDHKIKVARGALLAAAGVVLDVRAEDDLVTPGQVVRVNAQVWNGGPRVLRAAAGALSVPAGWTVEEVTTEGVAPDGSVGPGTLGTWAYDVTVPSDADLSSLYFLLQEREEAWYRWPDQPRLWGLPRDPSPVQGAFRVTFTTPDGGLDVESEEPWSFVGVNPARGEYRRPVLVVPQLAVTTTPAGMIWPQGRSGPRSITVSVRSEGKGTKRGHVALTAPGGWMVSPERYDVELDAEGSQRSFAFEIQPGSGVASGQHTFHAVVVDEQGGRFEEGYAVIDYDHIERTILLAEARSEVSVFPVEVADELRVGYVMGTGDDGPAVIRQLGAEVDLLDPEAVRAGDFSAYDVVVVGVRAYETREDLRAANGQLLDYARGGGTVLVQYQQYVFSRGGFAPYPVDMSRPARRVAEQTAEVTVLDSEAPVFTTPNVISQEDFQGWVQERGLYFMGEWDEAFTPLLEMHDAGEEATLGSLLVAPVGDGLYVYAALSFFRQWASGTQGPYRLFANLISLKAEDWRAYQSGSP
jgi:LmbE family N-acetylglucosaminyl deacetylase